MFARYEQALALLREMLATAGLVAERRACLEEQRDVIAGYLQGYRHLANWIMASFHRIRGEAPPASLPPLPAIIQAEIDLYAGAAGPRLELMKKHKNDPVRLVDLSEFPITDHLGLEGWEAAHKPKQ